MRTTKVLTRLRFLKPAWSAHLPFVFSKIHFVEHSYIQNSMFDLVTCSHHDAHIFYSLNAQVTHSRIERRITHGYDPASFVAICTGPRLSVLHP